MAMVVSEPIERDYRQALEALIAAHVPFVVGGAWAVEHYVRLGRPAIDLDLMIDPSILDEAIQALAKVGGLVLEREAMQTQTCLRSAEIDLVHHFAQGEYAVGPSWRQHAVPGWLFDAAVLIAAPEELIWSKAFVASRHRFDGADIMHLLRATAKSLDWARLHDHLQPYPELLFAYLNLFQYCYPTDREDVPRWLMDDLLTDFTTPSEPTKTKICRGPLLDSTSFIYDIVAQGFEDVRGS